MKKAARESGIGDLITARDTLDPDDGVEKPYMREPENEKEGGFWHGRLSNTEDRKSVV